jgi:3-dehydroquinate dehydratase
MYNEIKFIRDIIQCKLHQSQIDFNHSHRTDVAEAFGFLRCSAATEKIIISYFEDGHTPSTAKMLHELSLLENCDELTVTKVLANTRENPTSRTFINIYEKFR